MMAEYKVIDMIWTEMEVPILYKWNLRHKRVKGSSKKIFGHPFKTVKSVKNCTWLYCYEGISAKL